LKGTTATAVCQGTSEWKGEDRPTGVTEQGEKKKSRAAQIHLTENSEGKKPRTPGETSLQTQKKETRKAKSSPRIEKKSAKRTL